MTAIKMNAVVALSYGTSEVLQFAQVKRPTAKTNEVLVKVHAASATRADQQMLTGKPYIARLFVGLTKPKHNIPGTGFSGEVVSVGSEVTDFKIGDEVFGETTLGFSTNAEFVAVPESRVILKKPENLSHAEASTLGDGAITSLNFLREIAQVKAGQKVLINGASGSLGTAAVQLANYFGAEVTAVSSTKNIGLVRSLGAHHVVDYTKSDFTQSHEKYDVIFDTIGKSSFGKTKKVLTQDGQYISPVMKFPLLMQMMWTSMFGSKKAKFAATGLKKDHELKAMASDLLEIIKEGKLKTVIDRQYPLEKAADAHQYISAGHKKGNVVIIVHN
ncbi:NAD(P)-dependent alcohol dehydrogenase [Halocola ammonii]